MKKTKNRIIERSEFRAYLKVADEYLLSAKDNFEKRRFIATCGDAVHTLIAASDALTIYFLGRRSSNESHLQAIQLLRQVIPEDADLTAQINRFQRVLGLKDAAEYGGGKVDRDDAETALRDAERFLAFVKGRVG